MRRIFDQAAFFSSIDFHVPHHEAPANAGETNSRRWRPLARLLVSRHDDARPDIARKDKSSLNNVDKGNAEQGWAEQCRVDAARVGIEHPAEDLIGIPYHCE